MITQRVADGEAQHKRVGVRIRESSQVVVELLARCVPDLELNSADVSHVYFADVVFECRWFVGLFKRQATICQSESLVKCSPRDKFPSSSSFMYRQPMSIIRQKSATH